jgi:hypothetical protein
MSVGPSAKRVKSVVAAVPPLLLFTTLTRVSVAAWRVLVNVQVMSSPSSISIEAVRVPRLVVVLEGAIDSTHERAVSANPGSGFVSVTVLSVKSRTLR